MTRDEAIHRIKGWRERNQDFINHPPNGYTKKCFSILWKTVKYTICASIALNYEQRHNQSEGMVGGK